MSLVITTNTITTAGTKQFNDLPIVFSGYQVKDSLISNKIYTDNSSAYPATAIATGSASTISTNFPLAGDLFATIYNPGNTIANVPLVGRQRDYTRVTAGAIADGVKWAVSWDMTLDNWFVVVVKSGGTSVAGKLTVRSTAGNESVCAFTTSSVANTWESKIFNFKTAGATGVTITGAPAFAAITEIEVTLDAASNADVAMAYAVNNYSQIIGSRIAYRHACVSEANFQNTLEMADLLCGQQVEQKTGSGRTIEITVGSKKKDIEAQAIGIGDIVRRKNGYFLEVLNDENVGQKAVTAGVITIPAGLNVALVEIEGAGVLKPYHEATAVPEGAYHYDTTTITTNALYNGKVLRVWIWNRVSKVTRQVKNLEMGFLGFLQMPRKTESDKYEYITTTKTQVSLQPEGFNDDFDQVNFMYSVYPQNGTYVEIANDL